MEMNGIDSIDHEVTNIDAAARVPMWGAGAGDDVFIMMNFHQEGIPPATFAVAGILARHFANSIGVGRSSSRRIRVVKSSCAVAARMEYTFSTGRGAKIQLEYVKALIRRIVLEETHLRRVALSDDVSKARSECLAREDESTVDFINKKSRFQEKKADCEQISSRLPA